MFEKQLRPLPPQPKFRHFSEPIFVNFPYTRIAKGPAPFSDPPAEWAVEFDVGDPKESAFVPSFSVNEDDCTVRAALVGKLDDDVLVRLAITQLGSETFYVHEDRLVELIPSLYEYN